MGMGLSVLILSNVSSETCESEMGSRIKAVFGYSLDIVVVLDDDGVWVRRIFRNCNSRVISNADGETC